MGSLHTYKQNGKQDGKQNGKQNSKQDGKQNSKQDGKKKTVNKMVNKMINNMVKKRNNMQLLIQWHNSCNEYMHNCMYGAHTSASAPL